MAPVSVKSPPPPKPGFGALVTIEWSRRYSQYASNSPTWITSPPATRRSWVPVEASAITAVPGLCASPAPSAAAGSPRRLTFRSARPPSKSGGAISARGRRPLPREAPVDRARIETDRGVRPAAPHVGDHLDARARERPVVGVAHQDQQGPRHDLVHQRVAPARIDGDRRREAGRRQRDAPPPRALEARAVH